MKPYHAIGIMSGSSLDGLDIAYCSFSFDKKWSYKIIHSKEYSIECWVDRLKNARDLSEEKLEILDIAFGGFIGEKVAEFIKEFNIQELDIVSSHGHTVYHFPKKGITKQIGKGQQIFDRLKIPVLTNLRQADIDLGGSGAPIVPIGDLHLFSEYKYCLNIGGIANISIKSVSNITSVSNKVRYIPPYKGARGISSPTSNTITAFDICSANQVLNYFAFLKGKPFDNNGDLARKGKLNKELFESLNTLDYYKKAAPKSLDNLFTNQVLKHFKAFDISIEDKLNTYVEHIAFQISNSIVIVITKEEAIFKNSTCISKYSNTIQLDKNKQVKQSVEKLTDCLSMTETDRILITGGGAFNGFLIERITDYLQQKNISVIVPSKETINYKEALVMAFMGVLYLRNEVNCLKSVTGASRDSVCGEIQNM